MSGLRGKSQQVLFILFLSAFTALFACTETQEGALIDAATKVSVELDEALVTAPQLAFAGKVTHPESGQWLNDYVAIVYKDGEEVGRDVSKLGEFPESGQGKHDGLFVVKVDNDYDLTAVDLVPPQPDMVFQDGRGVVGVKYIYAWVNNAPPGYSVNVSAPSKRIIYTLIVIPQPLSELPDEFQKGPTTLSANNSIIAFAADGTPSELSLNAPISSQPVVDPPPGSGGVSWTRAVTGFYGSRWDAWRQYVDGQVIGITWEEFKDESLRYNPDLTADGFVFQPGKQYLFPEN